ncbi:HEPN domain-containing protein [Spirosoma aerolatum]|uniref:HEPN domain-containing protein n=1 Tax=Spirosoma aerolatum TaxID=1211326 RepID=UPI001FE4B4AA|nr:HEPN domain-containing protein [Spirosoma aerolatum]
MKEQIDRFLEHASDTLDDAQFLHQNGRVLALVNRAYYAIFYCVCALLLTEGITTKKHEGARVKFHELFIKTGRFSRDAGKILERNFAARQSADYDMEAFLSDEEAKLC